MTSFALMFNVLEGGVSEPIRWDKNNLTSDRSIIILDESNQVVWLWHGSKQGLVARRTALRQAESLKGHGFTAGKSIIGRDIKTIKEIDERKVGRDPDTDIQHQDLQVLLNREFKEVNNLIVTFDLVGAEKLPQEVSPTPKPEPKPVSAPPPVKPEPKPVSAPPLVKSELVKQAPSDSSTSSVAPINYASEYDDVKSKSPPNSTPTPEEPPKTVVSSTQDMLAEARIAFVIKAIMDHYDDIWVSKKDDGSYGVEMMDGPICTFKIRDSKISFTPNSFSGVATTIKTEIQKKFVELSKLL